MKNQFLNKQAYKKTWVSEGPELLEAFGLVTFEIRNSNANTNISTNTNTNTSSNIVVVIVIVTAIVIVTIIVVVLVIVLAIVIVIIIIVIAPGLPDNTFNLQSNVVFSGLRLNVVFSGLRCRKGVVAGHQLLSKRMASVPISTLII